MPQLRKNQTDNTTFTQANPKWIKAEENLPSANWTVLFVDATGADRRIKVGSCFYDIYGGRFWREPNSNLSIQTVNVPYWIPFPPMPK